VGQASVKCLGVRHDAVSRLGPRALIGRQQTTDRLQLTNSLDHLVNWVSRLPAIC
jgi:hypothetical protein